MHTKKSFISIPRV